MDGNCEVNVPTLSTWRRTAIVIIKGIIGSISLPKALGGIGAKGFIGVPTVTGDATIGHASKILHETSKVLQEVLRDVVLCRQATRAAASAKLFVTYASRPMDGQIVGMLHGVTHQLGMTEGIIYLLRPLARFAGELNQASAGGLIGELHSASRLKIWRSALTSIVANSSHSCATGRANGPSRQRAL